MGIALFLYGAAAIIGGVVVVVGAIGFLAYCCVADGFKRVFRRKYEWKSKYLSATCDVEMWEGNILCELWPDVFSVEPHIEKRERLLDEEPGWFAKYSRRAKRRRRAKGLPL